MCNDELESSMYMKKEVTVDVSTKMKKIRLENYDIMVLLMNSKTNDNNNYHVSVECLNIDDGEIYENIEGSFFETIEEADEYFYNLYEKYSGYNVKGLEYVLKHIK